MDHKLGPVDVTNLESHLRKSDVELVLLCFVDNAGICRAKIVPLERLARAAEAGIGASTVFGVFTGNDWIAQSGNYHVPVGDMRLIPDLGALRVGPGCWAWAPVDQYDLEGRAWPLCARGALRRALSEASSSGLSFLAGYEQEFFVCVDDELTPVNGGPAYGMAAVDACRDVVAEIHAALKSHGVDVAQLHSEYSPGQIEVSFGATDPLTASDGAVFSRSVIRTTIQRGGFRVSFSPLVRQGMVGNGFHLHLSVWKDGGNLLAPGDDLCPGTEGQSFIAGLLDHLPGLMGIAAASPVSFMRIGPSRWTGAYKCWGVENREAPIRYVPGDHKSRPDGANVEIKCFDSSANPYLLAAGAIAAGIDGLKNALTLVAAVEVDPATLSDAERTARGIEPLPASQQDATVALTESSVFRTALGDDLVDAIVSIRRTEDSAATAMEGEDDVLDYYRWRY